MHWKHHIDAVRNGAVVELTPRYALHAAPVTKASPRARRKLDELLAVLGADGLTLGTAAVGETTPAGTNWYSSLTGVDGECHWVRGAGLRNLTAVDFHELRLSTGMCLWGAGALNVLAGSGEVALTSGKGKALRESPPSRAVPPRRSTRPPPARPSRGWLAQCRARPR
ncbi:hypothetical protein [Kibdelosporangium phytohabitans]|uniref:hypothetical protein n=1 Tax=Kibdelosporangium phytohabitans TaxID=860235 RepID=UPI0017895AC3|nr:hypothetical protein [Kibdelosporangium phytohabitans]